MSTNGTNGANGTKGTGGPAPRLWWLAADDVDGLLRQLDTLPTSALEDQVPDPSSSPGPVRLGIVDPNERKVRLARRLVAKGEPWRGRSDIWFTAAGLAGPASDAGSGKVAFLFPGVEPTFGAEATDLPALGERLGLEAPTLADDTVAHRSVSIFQVGIFLDLVMRRLGVEPNVVAGHSVGEWSGAVAAGMIPHERANELIAGLDLHGVELPDVDFAALGAGVERVAPLLVGLDEVVVSHDNSPRQTVICGPPAEIEKAMARLRAANVLGYTLSFQSGFHTPAIAPLIEGIRHLAGGLPFGPARVPMWSSTLLAPYPDDHDAIVDLHLRHLVEPVGFRPLIERLYHDEGVRIFVQVGIGSLTGFVDDTLDDDDHACVQLLVSKRSALAQIQRALTALWVEGRDVRPDALRDAAPAQPEPGVPADPSPRMHTPPVQSAESVASPEPGPAAESVPSVQSAESVASPEPGPAAESVPSVPSVQPVASPEPVPSTAALVGGLSPVAAAAASPASTYTLTAAAEMVSNAARASQEVIDALAARLGVPISTGAPAATLPAPPLVEAAPPVPAPPTTPLSQQEAPPPEPVAVPTSPAAPPRTGKPWPTEKITTTRRLSLEEMPEMVDHTLYHQPEGWPDVSDGFPIVAMTSQVAVMREVAAEYAGGRAVIEVAVRNTRWLDLSTPQEVAVTVLPMSDDELVVGLGEDSRAGEYSRARIRVGDFPPAPRYEGTPLSNSRPTTHTAQDLWDLRLMFHGPRFQGINSMGPIGDDGIFGSFRKLDTPGIHLDNLGKLIAYMAIDRGGIGEGALPVGVDKIEFFGPTPAVGTDIHCDIRLVSLEKDLIRANGVMVRPDGTIWCRVSGWHSLVFHLDEVIEPIYHRTSRNYATEPQPGGWNVLLERWPMGAARELTARRFMARREREEFGRMNLLEQRRWILHSIAVKDTVRRWLGETFDIPAFPVEVSVIPEDDRHYRVECPLIPEGHDPCVTVSLIEWLAVTVLGDGHYRDIEARPLPEGGDAESLAREIAAAVGERNPGAQVSHAAGATNLVPSRLNVTPTPFAVAWT